jgi:hypothetical protein
LSDDINGLVDSINTALTFDEGNLTSSISFDTTTDEMEFCIGERSFKTKISEKIAIEPIMQFDPNCKKAAEAYIAENPDLKAAGLTYERALSHYNSHGSFEGRKWKSELCK